MFIPYFNVCVMVAWWWSF